MAEFYSIQDVLNLAIHLEQASVKFYQHLSQTIPNPSLSDFFQGLVREEQLHEQQIKKLLQRTGEIPASPISCAEAQEYIQTVRIPLSMDFKKAVKLALDKEKSAQMLYSLLARAVEDPDLREMFLTLSGQEEKHREFFEKEYRRIQLGEN